VFFKETQQIVIGSQIGEWEAEEHLKLHLLRIYHTVIQSQLKYLIQAKVLGVRKYKTVQKTEGLVGFGILMG